MTKTIVITGISSGIGEHVAKKILSLGYTVVAIGRDKQKTQNKFVDCKEGQLLFFTADLSQNTALNTFESFLNENKITSIDALVNNAGVAYASPYEVQDFFQVEEMVTVNLLSVMRLTHMMIPYLSKNEGRIVNISSVSGQQGTPFLAAYCATKHAIEGFSESLRRELAIHGLYVSVIGPGSVKTPIWNKGLNKISKIIQESIYKNAFQKFIAFAVDEEKHGLEVDVVVENVIHAILSSQPKIRYYPIPRKWRNYYLPKLFTKKYLDKLMTKNLGLTKKP